MTCLVVKTIKGNRYLYEQTSRRVNGKVRTTTRYIGPTSAGRKRGRPKKK